jgi:uncharacterized protein with HEPN domain
MSERDPRVTLEQLIELITEAREYVKDQTLETMLGDKLRLRAFERVMECMGEAVKRLPQKLREQYPQVPWRKVAAMRDYLSHGYDDIQYVTLWDALRLHVPDLEATVVQMLKDLDGGVPPQTSD